jgi:FdhD protein
MGDPRSPVAEVDRAEWQATERSEAPDQLVREEPLEIRLRGVPIAVVMRTPGHDEELVRGFLRTEGIVETDAAITSIRYCNDIDDPEAEHNVVQVVLDPSVEIDLARIRRNMFTSSSCGVCGKASLEHALAVAGPLPPDASRVELQVLYALPQRLRTEQPLFSSTGGLHAAGLFDASGSPLVVREDIGRHNAVDKAVGWAGRNPQRSPVAMMVSGRVSFEITQKALAARIPVIAAVSAPSSLAVELARRSNMTLVAFVRGERLCVYAGEDRIQK